MKQLFTVFVCVISILILHFIKQVLSNTAESYYFWYNFLSCGQLFLLTLAIIYLILKNTIYKNIIAWRVITRSVIVLVAILSIMEVLITWWLNNPSKAPHKLLPYLQNYYVQYDAAIFQYEPDCDRYDPHLFYKMPSNSHFVFKNREFANDFYSDSKGFRNNPEIFSPVIASIGDSYSLGYNVRQDQTIAANLQRLTAMPTINVSNSSYGTAREFLSLQEIDPSKIKYLVWQYCPNDKEENEQFIANNYKYIPPSIEKYNYLKGLNRWSQQYFPFKRSLTLLKIFGSGLITDGTVSSDAEPDGGGKEAANFLKIIEQLPANLSQTTIIVVELGHYKKQSLFIDSLKKLLKGSFEHLAERIIPVDVYPILQPQSYYLLDIHLNPEAYQKVAKEIARHIKN